MVKHSVNGEPLPGQLAADEQRYHQSREEFADAVAAARLLLRGRRFEAAAFHDLCTTLSLGEHDTAIRISAAAILYVAKQESHASPPASLRAEGDERHA